MIFMIVNTFLIKCLALLEQRLGVFSLDNHVDCAGKVSEQLGVIACENANF